MLKWEEKMQTHHHQRAHAAEIREINHFAPQASGTMCPGPRGAK